MKKLLINTLFRWLGRDLDSLISFLNKLDDHIDKYVAKLDAQEAQVHSNIVKVQDVAEVAILKIKNKRLKDVYELRDKAAALRVKANQASALKRK